MFASTILPNVIVHMTAKRKVAGSRRLKSHAQQCFGLHPTHLQLWDLWVPGEESRGGSKTEEESSERHTDENQLFLCPSHLVLVQSAKSGCKRTVNILDYCDDSGKRFCLW